MPKYRKPTCIMTNLQFTSTVINWFTATYFHGFDEPMNNLRQAQGKFGLLAIKNIFDNNVLMNFVKFS